VIASITLNNACGRGLSIPDAGRSGSGLQEKLRLASGEIFLGCLLSSSFGPRFKSWWAHQKSKPSSAMVGVLSFEY